MESLRRIREQVGYSQQELADESDVSQHTISEIELGRRKPQGRTLRKLSKALGVEVADLRGGPDHPLAKAPPSSTQPPLNGFEEERRKAQETAVENAQVVRQRGRGQMTELIAAWRTSKERGELRSSRRRYLDGITKLLNEAHEAREELLRNFFRFGGNSPQARQALEEGKGWVPNWDWERVREADRLYLELMDMLRQEPDFRVEEPEFGPPKVEAA